jgi:NhaA family Na+:H+ antiporter
MTNLTFQKFLKLESLGGILLFLAAMTAVGFENSTLGPTYEAIRDFEISFAINSYSLSKPLLLWVNDGLMAIFFLSVALELKREIHHGQLSSPAEITLPLFAAIGGIIIPAAIYAFINWGDSTAMKGWAIPTSTDIAFALGVLLLFGKRVPLALKVFLTALAILDDIAAIVIIAIFYTESLFINALAVAAVTLGVLFLLNRLHVKKLSPYVLVGVILWVAVLKSGVHATLAGVALAMAIPFARDTQQISPVKLVEKMLHPWIIFAVLPLFAFLNAGVSLKAVTLDSLLDPLTFGIAIGLFVGKQIGVFGGAWLAVRLRLANLPDSVSWQTLYGTSLLTGVGFTMSLFIGTLAFATPEALTQVRLGVIAGSLFSGLFGLLVLHRGLPTGDESTLMTAGNKSAESKASSFSIAF